MFKKYFQKVVELALIVSLMLTSIPFVASAAELFDSGVLGFEGLSSMGDLENYMYTEGLVDQNVNPPFENASSGDIVPVTWESSSADAAFGTSVAIKRGGNNSALRIYERGTANAFTDNVTVSFSMKKMDLESCFMLEMRNVGKANNGGWGDSEYVIKFDGSSHIQLFENQVCRYEVNTWYDVVFNFNFQHSYGRMYIKKSDASQWNYYDAILPVNYDVTQGAVRVQLGYMAGGSSTTYVDNVRIHTLDVEDMTPSFESHSDDFEGTLAYTYSTPEDWTKEWLAQNFSQTEAYNDTLSGYPGKVMTMNSYVSSGGYFPCIVKQITHPSLAVSSVTHDIKFKMGYSTTDTQARIVLDYNGGGYRIPLSIRDGRLFIADDGAGDGGTVGKVENITIQPGVLYDFELIYNASKQLAKVVFTDTDGSQIVKDINLGWGNLYKISFQQYAWQNSSIYLDDFFWGIMTEGGFECTDVSLKSNLPEAASLDETILISTSKGVDVTQTALESLSVQVEKNNELVDVPFNVYKTDNGMAIALDELEISTEYKVSVDGIKDILGETASAEITFTTADFDIEASQPVINADGSVSVNIKSAYNDGKDVYLIATSYSDDKRLQEAKHRVISADSREGETYTLSTGFSGKIGAVVWSDYVDMIPYTSWVKN